MENGTLIVLDDLFVLQPYRDGACKSGRYSPRSDCRTSAIQIDGNGRDIFHSAKYITLERRL